MQTKHSVLASAIVLIACYAVMLLHADRAFASQCNIACSMNTKGQTNGPPVCRYTTVLRAVTLEQYCCPALHSVTPSGGCVVQSNTEVISSDASGCYSDVTTGVDLAEDNSPGTVMWRWTNGYSTCTVTVNYICEE